MQSTTQPGMYFAQILLSDTVMVSRRCSEQTVEQVAFQRIQASRISKHIATSMSTGANWSVLTKQSRQPHMCILR